MPCYAEGPSHRELEFEAVCSYLKEAGVKVAKLRWYDKGALDSVTARLCRWCKEHPNRIKEMSLEFQIWWRDHQKADAAREAREAAARKQRALTSRAALKLTAEELKALMDSIRRGEV